jgi:hypothetical protein
MRQVAAALLWVCLAASAAGIGRTFGNGYAGLSVCQGNGKTGPTDTVILNHTVSHGASHGVLHHFWVTGDHFPGGIDEVWVSYFVDGEATASIEFQPSQMCGHFFPEMINETDLYAAGSLCGRNSAVGGWFNTFPVPFSKSIVVTARPSALLADAGSCIHSYWNVRGTESLPVVLPLSGIPLPPTARLRLQRMGGWATRRPLEYVNVSVHAPGQRGLIFLVGFAVEARPVGGSAAGGGYVEGCWQFYREHDEPFPGLVVGTGVEDYFDSAFYFGGDTSLHRGLTFANALAGLPFFARDGVVERLSAYRFHASDPLVFADGGRLVWRVGEGHQPQPESGGTQRAGVGPDGATSPRIFTKCGNQYPKEGAQGQRSQSQLRSREVPLQRTLSAVNVSTYSWAYVW